MEYIYFIPVNIFVGVIEEYMWWEFMYQHGLQSTCRFMYGQTWQLNEDWSLEYSCTDVKDFICLYKL